MRTKPRNQTSHWAKGSRVEKDLWVGASRGLQLIAVPLCAKPDVSIRRPPVQVLTGCAPPNSYSSQTAATQRIRLSKRCCTVSQPHYPSSMQKEALRTNLMVSVIRTQNSAQTSLYCHSGDRVRETLVTYCPQLTAAQKQ